MKNKFYIIISLLVLSLGMSIYLFVSMKSRALEMVDDQAAKRFGSGSSYAEIRALFSEKEEVSEESIIQYRSQINSRLLEDHEMKEEEANPTATDTDALADVTPKWMDAYSSELKVTARNEQGEAELQALAFGGDFFQIHPRRLASGSYPENSDPHVKEVLLDEGAAWALFGGTELEGEKVWIGNEVFTVTGVVAGPHTKDEKLAYGSYNRIYIPYTYAQGLKKRLPITCYEAVLPNPFEDYALNLVKKVAGLETLQVSDGEDISSSNVNFDSKEVVDITSRYSLLSLFQSSDENLCMKTNDIIYPFWENVSRAQVFRQARALKWAVAFACPPFLGLIWLFWRLYRQFRRAIHKN